MDTLSPGQLVPSLETLVPHRYCGEPPCTHSLHSSFQLDTHKVLVHQKSKHKSPRAALWQVFIGSGAAYSFAMSANQLQALYLLYIGISASHICETGVVFRECVPSKISIADPINDAHKAESVKAKLSPVPSPPATVPHVKTTKSSIGSNDKFKNMVRQSSKKTTKVS